MMDELETFSTYADLGEDDLEDHPKRGRPPKPWRRAPSPPTWFESLGIAG